MTGQPDLQPQAAAAATITAAIAADSTAGSLPVVVLTQPLTVAQAYANLVKSLRAIPAEAGDVVHAAAADLGALLHEGQVDAANALTGAVNKVDQLVANSERSVAQAAQAAASEVKAALTSKTGHLVTATVSVLATCGVFWAIVLFAPKLLHLG